MQTRKIEAMLVGQSDEAGRPFELQKPVMIIREQKGEDQGHTVFKLQHRSVGSRATDGKVVWGGDCPADVYGARDLKGSGAEKMPQVRIIEDPDRGVFFEVEGMMDQDEIDVFAASRRVREELGLPTERPVAIHKLNSVRMGYEKMVSIDEWRKWARKDLVFRADQFIDEKMKNWNWFEKTAGLPFYLGYKWAKKAELMIKGRRYIDQVEFYQEERDLQTQERVADLIFCKDEQEFTQVWGKVMNWVNVACEARGSGIIPGTDQPARFDVNNPDDVKRYAGEWLPAQIGLYLGRMHKHNLAANFPHAQNWSAVGTLVDLSSCFVPIQPGSEKLVKSEDLVATMKNLLVLFKLDSQENYFGQNFGSEMAEPAIKSFLEAYLKESGEKFTPGRIQNIGRVMGGKSQTAIFDGRISKGFRFMTDKEIFVMRGILEKSATNI